MYEAYTALVGNVVTHPVRRSLPNGQQLVTFRMASNARRLDRGSGDWVDNGTVYVTVNCWRKLVEGVDASLSVGDPILVYGQLRSNEYRTKEGHTRQDLELRANAIGPDLGRCTATVLRRGNYRKPTEPRFSDSAPAPSSDAEAGVPTEPTTRLVAVLDSDASGRG
ncbi:single-stranded DNA-binding protein [Nocardia macrotermitis]|uniref:Single-stranded DNA-binding protein n=1 Tax=Nocardia macrotermitis TaxID=2585198 RepID=A0A7K0D3M0_9NOCA|nr:single-stranded DNA-binding protein [Nocardia macrotermitis]MQY20326.1 Single-stranded DNA-binding protein 1 [Nocardia macrotermitis]